MQTSCTSSKLLPQGEGLVQSVGRKSYDPELRVSKPSPNISAERNGFESHQDSVFSRPLHSGNGIENHPTRERIGHPALFKEWVSQVPGGVDVRLRPEHSPGNGPGETVTSNWKGTEKVCLGGGAV